MSEAEIRKHCVPIFIEQHVGWFHIPVRDALRMGKTKRIRYLINDLNGPFDGSSLLDNILQSTVGIERHDDVCQSHNFAEIDDGKNMRVIERA